MFRSFFGDYRLTHFQKTPCLQFIMKETKLETLKTLRNNFELFPTRCCCPIYIKSRGNFTLSKEKSGFIFFSQFLKSVQQFQVLSLTNTQIIKQFLPLDCNCRHKIKTVSARFPIKMYLFIYRSQRGSTQQLREIQIKYFTNLRTISKACLPEY